MTGGGEEQIILNGFTLTLLGAIGTTLSATVGALWLALNNERTAHNNTRDKMQEKIDTIARDSITAINNTAIAANSSNSTTVGFKEVLTKVVDEVQALKDEIREGRGRGQR